MKERWLPCTNTQDADIMVNMAHAVTMTEKLDKDGNFVHTMIRFAVARDDINLHVLVQERLKYFLPMV